MKVVLEQQSMIYSILVDVTTEWNSDGTPRTFDEKEYTLYVSEERQGCAQYELVDEDGQLVDDDDLLEEIIEEVNDLPTLGF